MPTVIYPDEGKVSIYGYHKDDPQPILIEKCSIEHAEKRMVDLTLSMAPEWTLQVWRKVTNCKQVGFVQTRRKPRRLFP